MMLGVAMERADDTASGRAAGPASGPADAARGQTPEGVFQEHRPLLFHIAYRMLGTVSDAEDIVQEAWIRWQRGGAGAETPKAYLAQVVTRLAIDRLREARRTREEYVGPWLPEPLLTEPAGDTADIAAVRSETLRTGFLVMLERLGPVERAVFVLREAFDYDYAEIAQILGKTEAACRQILVRAHRHMATDRPRFTDRAANERIALSFLSALAMGDLGQIERLLAEDAVFYSDGGGKVAAARNPIYGADRVVRFLGGILSKLGARRLESRPAYINGEPGVILWVDGQLYGTMVLECAEGRVRAVHGVRNPDKLAHIA